MKVKIFLCTLALYICLAECNKLPPYFPRCARNDLDLNNCFAEAVEKNLNFLTKPIPEVGLPKADPLEISNVPLPLHATIKNMKIYNILATKVIDSVLELGDKHVKIAVELFSPWYRAEANVQVGNQTEKPNTIKVEAVRMYLEVSGVLYDKEGQRYIRIKDVKADGMVDQLEADIKISDNDSTNTQISKFVNENWEIILNGFKTQGRDRLHNYIKDIGNKFLGRYPYDELFSLS